MHLLSRSDIALLRPHSCFLGAFLATFRVSIVLCIAGGGGLQKH